MRFAAFFRNLNLGRPRSPSKQQFVGAFEAAGAHDVESVRSHGNILFSASGVRQARAIAGAASERMRLQCGLDEPVFVRSLKYLGELIAAEPFANAPTDDVDERCVTFLPAGMEDLPQATIVTPRRDAEIFGFQANEIFSVTRLVGGRPGPVNALLERRLRTRLTTRNWNTVCRLALGSV
jgi:uncharacterized protein (DUF1697 family)